MYRKMLVPLDGLTLAEEPLRYAAWLDHRTELEIISPNVHGGQLAPMSH